jgi:hypothetical protein
MPPLPLLPAAPPPSSSSLHAATARTNTLDIKNTVDLMLTSELTLDGLLPRARATARAS